MKHLRIVLAAAWMALAVAGMAQQGRGVMIMRGSDNVGLVNRADVQADLQLTAEQKTKVAELQKSLGEKRQSMMEDVRNNGGDFQSARAQMEKMQADFDKQILAVLTPDQAKRLKEIRLQLEGNRAILNKETQKELGLTEAQLAKIEKLLADQQAGMQTMMEGMRDGSMTREEMRDQMQKRMRAFDVELGKVLTTEQADKLKAMGGKPFKAEEQKRGGGGS